MKTTTIRDFRGRVAELVGGDETVLVTRHGKPAAVLYPLRNPEALPPRVRRKLFLEMTAAIADELDARGITEEEILREFNARRRSRRR